MMTTPSDDQLPEDENESPEVTYRFLTPYGSFDSIADLPPAIRDLLAKNLDAADLPEELRSVIKAGLDAGVVSDAEAMRFGTAAAREAHREQVWNLLDAAFPRDPHLWQAGEALFTLSVSNPDEIDEETRRIALSAMALHLQRHAALTSPAESPVDQLVAKFRQQMDDI